MVLRWMIAKCNQSNAKIFLALQLSRLKNVRTNLLDILCGRGNVTALAAGTVLDENKIPIV